MTIKLQQLLSLDSKLFAKSEFGPANEDWPALSFSSNKIARDFHLAASRGKDFVIYVGTSNPEDTPVPQHRQCLMSVVDVEPLAIVQTKQIISPQSWARAQAKYPGRWDVSLRLARAWEVLGFPRAREEMPKTYAKFQSPATRGHPIPVAEEDYERLRSLELVETPLTLTERADNILALNTDDADLRTELSRLANLIQQDVVRSLKEYIGAHPLRKAPNYSDVFLNLSKAWTVQRGACALCSMPIPLKPRNKLLQMSRDRVDSMIKEYNLSNVHLAHLGCNLAKSDATMPEWNEFRAMLRSPVDPPEFG